MSDLETLSRSILDEIGQAPDEPALETIRVAALGKKGKITDLMKNLGAMSPEERKNTGQALNELKDEIAALIAKQEDALKKQALDARLATETIDVTLSIRPEAKGHIHPISQTMEELTAIFADMGFTVADGGSGEVTMAIRKELVDIQRGRAEDPFGWVHRVL